MSGDVATIWARRALLVFGAGAALTAVQAGLARVGIALGWGPSQAAQHGPLFVVGLFGTVISLERAVALGHSVALVIPSAFVVASVAMVIDPPFAAWVAFGASLGLVFANLLIVRRQSLPFTWVMLAGSVVFAVGTMSWAAGLPISRVSGAWMSFFVLTVIAERLELSRLVPVPGWARTAVVLLAFAHGVPSGVVLLGFDVGARLAGGAAVLLGLWELTFDLARRTIRQQGLPRYTALGVLLGAGWLVVSGVASLVLEVPPAGPRYDAVLHTLFVGYVLSMVFAHAPLILPAVARVALPMHPVLFVPMVMLQVGLALRLVGDLSDRFELRQAGAVINAVTLAVFLISAAVLRGSVRLCGS